MAGDAETENLCAMYIDNVQPVKEFLAERYYITFGLWHDLSVSWLLEKEPWSVCRHSL